VPEARRRNAAFVRIAAVVEEARLEETESGLEPATDGWFVLNVRDAQWLGNDHFGACAIFEGDDAPHNEVGFTLGVMYPGKPSGLYHAESSQEDFLVLSGECILLIEGEERPLRAWDFVHCPAGTEHIFVGAGEGPCVVFATGGRTGERALRYPRNDVALRRGAGVEHEVTTGAEAYASYPKWERRRPDSWDGLPWA
jgi:uncharacterized cupin superfamily protein